MMTDILRDLRFGARMLIRHRTATVISVLTLALGIGASTAVFSIVDATLLRPLPFEEPDRLVRLFTAKPSVGWTTMTVSAADFQDWSEETSTFEGTGIYARQAVNFMGSEHPERLTAIRASAGVLQVLRIQPTRGRTYDASSDRPDAAKVILLSDATWRQRFGADPEVVGSVVRIDHVPHEVLGVLPPEVAQAMGDFDIWTPFIFDVETAPRSSRAFRSIARLRDGVSVLEADRKLKVVGDRLAELYPVSNRGHTVTVRSLAEVLLGRDTRTVLYALCAAVAFVLLIACVNIANLLLATAGSRVREFAVRTALGAGPRRLVRQLLAESALLVAFGGALGVAVAFWSVGIFTAGLDAIAGSTGEATVDLRALVFAFVLLGVTSPGIGLPVALRASRSRFADTIRSASRGSLKSPREKIRRDALVITQVALALALMISAALMIRSLVALRSVDPGFNTEKLLTMRVSLPEERYPTDPEKCAFFERAVSEIDSMPGLRSASASTMIPLLGSNSNGSMTIEDHPISDPADTIYVGAEGVTPGYLETMGIPLIEGREFTAIDREDSQPVIIINSYMARHFWPNESAIGKRVKYGQPDGDLPWFEVIGIMGDHRQTSLDTPPRFETLYPQARFPSSAMTVVARTEGDPGSMTNDVRAAIWKIDPGLGVYQIDTMDTIVARNTRSIDDLTNLLAGFGGIALVLALGGLYGLMSFTVGRRTQEIGLRMALGAEARSILLGVLSRSALLVSLGVLAGGLIGWSLTFWLRGLFFEISAFDPVAYTAAAVGMLMVGLIAGLIPALRAARVNPVVALRYE